MIRPDETPVAASRDAREALAETRASSAVTAAIIEEARVAFGSVREHRVANHYAEKFRAIIRGTQ